ncbi:MAG TPA: PAS domain-containing sensor histidine kinase [Candidatus Atribacteria bacterium]|nr:PAS domain-containing sensor histidine kinase [Candidatus Atribacteria bacterium]
MIKKISWKLFFTYIIIIIICVMTIGLLSTVQLRNFYINHLASNLESNATLIKNFLYEDLSENNLSGIKSKTETLGREINTRITIINTIGTVLGDSEKDPALMENHADRPEIKEALQGKTGKSIRYSSTLEIDMLYIAIPIIKDNQTLGIARLSLPLTEVNENISNLHKIIILATAITLAIASIISLIISLTITRPLQEMTKVSQKISKGDFSKKLKINSQDEVGQLANSLNLMSEELENKIRIISEDKDKMKVILSSIIEGIIAIDKEGRIILFNHALGNMIDYSFDRVLGKFHWEIIRNNQLNELLKETLQKGQTLTREIILFSPQEKIFHASANPLTEKNKIWGAVVVLNDITEIKKLEKMRSEFVANVSHELRTPLTSIQGFVETLKEGVMDDPKKARYFLTIIERQSNRLNTLIEDLLQLSRIESQEILMNFQSVNLKELVDQITLEFKGKIEDKKQHLKVDISPRLPLLKVDSEQIATVLRNLLDNAIKYTPNRGEISISALKKAENIYIEVADNGIGISAEHLPRLFERFYRVDKDRSRKLGETGLGLAIVKHIVQAHGGTVGVDSGLGKGSKFFFTLPKNPLN